MDSSMERSVSRPETYSARTECAGRTSSEALVPTLEIRNQFAGRSSPELVRKLPACSLRAVCAIAVVLSSIDWRNVSFFERISASRTATATQNMNNHDIYGKNWEPALPVANNSYVVEEDKLPVLGRHIQYLRPGDQYVILIANTSAITVMPPDYKSEAYGVEDGLCDMTSRKSYGDIFAKTPAGYQFWKVQEHKLKAGTGQDTGLAPPPGSALPEAGPPGAQGPTVEPSPVEKHRNQRKPATDGKELVVTSLLFTAPSENQMDDDDEEFCIAAEEKTKEHLQNSVSLIVIVNSAPRIFTISGLAIAMASTTTLFRSLSFF